MNEQCRALADAIGRLVVERDFDAIRARMAPWAASSMDAAAIEQMIDAACEGLAPPVSWSVDESPMDVEGLREPDGYGPPSTAFSPAITPANYRGWLCVQFQPDPDNPDGFNVCFDLWMAAVELDGDLRIGYLEAAEAS